MLCYKGNPIDLSRLTLVDTLRTCIQNLLTFYQTTNFNLLKIEEKNADNFKIWRKWQKILQMDLKHGEKRRNCSYRTFSAFPAVFSKNVYCRHVETRACLGKGYLCVFHLYVGLQALHFSFSRSVFKRHIFQTLINLGLFGKGLPVRVSFI